MQRDRRGRFKSTTPALDRFIAKCEFDAVTGCVNWTGGQTAGHGHNVPYGAFWFEGRRWFAHRWAAKHILGLDIDRTGYQVDHECRNTLCVRHLAVVTATFNRELQWVRCQKGVPGYEYEPGPAGDVDGVPWFAPPDWWPKADYGDEVPF